MQDGKKSHNAVDPLELWRQWNETTFSAWLQAMESSKEAVVEPYNLYRAWMKGANTMQEQVKSNPLLTNSTELWKAWFEATMETWKKAAELGADPLGLTRQWLKLMEEAQARLSAGQPLSVDPFTLFRDWYNATNEQWSKAVEEAIGSEKFLEYSAPFLESYTSLTRAFKRASEEYLNRLQVPTLQDIARVAELVINLEEKIDHIEDALDGFEASQAKLATAEAVAALEQRLGNVATTEAVTLVERRFDNLATTEAIAALEQRLNNVATAETVASVERRFESVATGEAIANMERRFESVATTKAVAQLEQQLGSLATVASVTGLEKRIEQVESKLDTVLTLLKRLAAKEVAPKTEAAPHRSAKKSTPPTTQEG